MFLGIVRDVCTRGVNDMVVGIFFVLKCLGFQNIAEYSTDLELKYKIGANYVLNHYELWE